MTVGEANKNIERIDNAIKNLEKLLELDKDAQRALEEKAVLNTTLVNMVNTSVNAMLSWKNVLKNKIENAKIDF